MAVHPSGGSLKAARLVSTFSHACAGLVFCVSIAFAQDTMPSYCAPYPVYSYTCEQIRSYVNPMTQVERDYWRKCLTWLQYLKVKACRPSRPPVERQQ